MNFEKDKNNLSSLDNVPYLDRKNSFNSEVKDNSDIDKFFIEGDKFINNTSMVFETFMNIANWIMNRAYLIAVIIVVVLLIIKLNV